MTDIEIDYMIAEEALSEAEEYLKQLRKDYQELREHAMKLEELLKANKINYPEFYGR